VTFTLFEALQVAANLQRMTRGAYLLELGVVPYGEAWDLQRSIHADVVSGVRADTLLVLEHPAVYTAGKRTEAHERPFDGTPVVDVDRGGKITWHGPGQLTGYPIVALPDAMYVIGHVRRLEDMLMAVCASLGVTAVRIDGRSGAWVPGDSRGPDRKIGAIGVRVARGVTMHGFALNCNCDLAAFGRIVPCGIADAGGAGLGIKRAVDDGLVDGPRLRIAVTVLSQTAGHGDGWLPSGFSVTMSVPHPGRPAGIVDGPEEMRKRVREIVRAGADVIKVATTGGVLVAHGKVITGLTGCSSFGPEKCFISAYDADTGKHAWTDSLWWDKPAILAVSPVSGRLVARQEIDGVAHGHETGDRVQTNNINANPNGNGTGNWTLQENIH